MFWLGKTIIKINGSCIAKHMQNEQYKHASGRKLQCGHARSGNQDRMHLIRHFRSNAQALSHSRI